jgi:hypothetical protein
VIQLFVACCHFNLPSVMRTLQGDPRQHRAPLVAYTLGAILTYFQNDTETFSSLFGDLRVFGGRWALEALCDGEIQTQPERRLTHGAWKWKAKVLSTAQYSRRLPTNSRQCRFPSVPFLDPPCTPDACPNKQFDVHNVRRIL